MQSCEQPIGAAGKIAHALSSQYCDSVRPAQIGVQLASCWLCGNRPAGRVPICPQVPPVVMPFGPPRGETLSGQSLVLGSWPTIRRPRSAIGAQLAYVKRPPVMPFDRLLGRPR